MTWNAQELRQRFSRKQVEIEDDVDQLRRKAESNAFYRAAHDRQEGARQVFTLLAPSDALLSRYDLLRKLQTMRDDGPAETKDGFDPENVKEGWNKAIDDLASRIESTKA